MLQKYAKANSTGWKEAMQGQLLLIIDPLLLFKVMYMYYFEKTQWKLSAYMFYFTTY